ncbi:Heavy metal transport/detoxification superfamily protein [Prunus dulcis]|uniref:Heavy metal transport/detoxification superfamily protein n=1 Tax=Prunus dulcis TaxID=3755 RepID=A0A4Y1RRV8_PRUDU|nr:Heavy metal transport/detoxification superfamily protein [Prunus dulcis]
MATTTEPKAEAKAEPKEIEEISQPPLKYKTWVLRVSVHCEGCKKKINKSLKQMEGVYKTEVDMRQQKLTVTGNVKQRL